MLSLLERNIWLSVAIAGGLAVLVIAGAVRLGGGMPELKPLPETRPPSARGFAGSDAEGWLALKAVARAEAPTNAINPFYTLHFQPPPPPPTKKVSIEYQGCLLSSRGASLAYILLEDSLLILTNGARVVADHAISQIDVSTLTLTNAAGKTNDLKFKVKAILEVPAS